MKFYSLLSIGVASIKPFLGPVLRPAAYLDPGSGSYLLQILIALLLGGAFAVRAFCCTPANLLVVFPPLAAGVIQRQNVSFPS